MMVDRNLGARSDTPASVTVDETIEARTLISLSKGSKNLLIDISAYVAALVGSEDVAFAETDQMTRPANVTQYTAEDVVGELLEFDVAKVDGGGGWINNAMFVSDNPAAATGQFHAWIFTEAPTVAADNAAFAATDAELRTLVAILTLDMAEQTANGTAYQQSDPRATYFVCDPADSSLYVVIIDGNAYTPANGEVFDLTLFGTQE